MSAPDRSLRESPDLVTVPEIAVMMRVSRATVYRLVHAGALPGIRIGKSLRVPLDAVEAFLRRSSLHDSTT